MNFFQKWIIERFLRGYVKKGLDIISGPLNGKKSPLLGGLLAILVYLQSQTSAESVSDAIQLLIDQITSVGGASLEDATTVTVIGFIAAVVHRLLKSDAEIAGQEASKKK